MKYFLAIIFLSIFVIGCKNEASKTDNVEKVAKPEMSVVVNHKKPTALQADVKEKIKDWKQYFEFTNFLTRFENVSPSEALSNANELKSLISDLKKNIKLEPLKSDAFMARVDVLENEILRLYDMTLIPSITTRDINFQVDKVFLLSSSINAKINTVFMQQRYDKEVDLKNFFKLDSSEAKSTFKKMKRPDLKRKLEKLN